MNIFGFSITRQKALAGPHPIAGSGGWLPVIREAFTGAWQRNIEVRVDTVLTYSAVYSCVSLIASDIAKLRIRLVTQDENGIWTETENPAHSPVLRKQNRYQTRIDFFTNWVLSKLIHGNTYVLKVRDNRNVVSALYILDPTRTKVLVADDGSVFYELMRDNLSGLGEVTVTVPASEIIHDKMVALYHPLCGVSPIYACGVAAMQGINIQNSQTRLFGQGARPAGILTTPNPISDEKARELKDRWEAGFSGENYGRTAILGDGMTYIPMSMTAVDAQLIEQLKWTAETVCSCFHVPPYMVGIGPMPSYNNVEALSQMYYTQCLQSLIEQIEVLLDEGLELKKPLGTEFDLDDLLRMDTASRVKAAADAIGSGGMAPNEARKRYFDLGPVQGGASPYLQQQNFSLAALDERDRNKPFAKPEPAAPATPAAEAAPEDEAAAAEARHLRVRAALEKELGLAA